MNIRARFLPDPNTPALPEPIHGLVAATYTVKTRHLPYYRPAKTILEVDVPTDDSKIQFTSAANTGLGPFELEQLVIQIRKALREAFEPVSLELPPDFPFSQFKGLGNALALPLRLTPPLVLPDSALGTVTNNFLERRFFRRDQPGLFPNQISADDRQSAAIHPKLRRRLFHFHRYLSRFGHERGCGVE